MTGPDLLEADALRSYAVFAEHRNFTTAAAALHISQPSLHVKIRKLAAAIGCDLYERDGRGLTLTPAGERLAAHATDARRRLDDFLADLGGTPTHLSIAAGRGALRWVVAHAIRRLSESGRTLHALAADRTAAVAALSAGRADVAVLANDPPPRHVGSAEIARYPQVLMVDRGHPLAAAVRLRLRDLDGLRLVVPPPDREHRRALDRALLDAGASWQVGAEADGWDLLVHLAALGLGAAVVNGCVPAPDGMVAIPVADLPTIPYWLAWRTARPGPAADLLAHLAQP